MSDEIRGYARITENLGNGQYRFVEVTGLIHGDRIFFADDRETFEAWEANQNPNLPNGYCARFFGDSKDRRFCFSKSS